MTEISYFGKQNSTLGSVVPLAMFSFQSSWAISYRLGIFWARWVGLLLQRQFWSNDSVCQQLGFLVTCALLLGCFRTPLFWANQSDRLGYLCCCFTSAGVLQLCWRAAFVQRRHHSYHYLKPTQDLLGFESWLLRECSWSELGDISILCD